MATRKVHWSQSDHHDRFGLHVWRHDRIAGVLAPESVWPRRVRVLLATGVLAISAGATGTSVASEPDDQQEGVVLPDSGGSSSDPRGGDGDQPSDDGAGRGSGDTALPFEVDPVLTAPHGDPATGQPDDSGPLEAMPVDDPDGRPQLPPDDTAPHTPEPGAGDQADDLPVPPSEPGIPNVPVTPGAPATPKPMPQLIAPDDPPASRRVTRRGPAEPRSERRRRDGRETHDDQAQTNAALPTDPPPAEAEAPVAPAATVTAPATPGPRIRGRFHVVRPGESLWSIATALLGPDASAADVARQVRRLWRLNAAGIGTGDPNLLRIGVKLRLR